MNKFIHLGAALAMIMACTVFTANGQSAPGGIGDLSGTSELKLWVSSQSTNVTTNNAPVDSLFDLSGAGNHLYAPSLDNRPVLLTDEINGYPVINFDGIQQYLLDPLPDTSFKNTEATLIAVAERSNQGCLVSISTANSSDEFLILNNNIYHHSSPFNWNYLGNQCQQMTRFRNT